MPRKLRIQFPGAVYHVMNRGDRQEDIFFSDFDRRDFLQTLADACLKTGFQIHAYCLMPNHFHLVLETPNGNLVEGMKWLSSSYTLRLNHRRKMFGHVFSGRYKAQIIEAEAHGYLKTACDYVHLNPVRANMLGTENRISDYPWSSFPIYLEATKNRPFWLRTDRLLGEHGFMEDSADTRKAFEKRMELRRSEHDAQSDEWKPLQSGWCLGGEEFREKMLDQMEGQLGEYHSGQLKIESASMKGERIIAQELQRLGWNESDFKMRLKTDPAKLGIARRLRSETTLTIRWMAERLNLGSWKSAYTRLHQLKRLSNGNIQDKGVKNVTPREML